MRGPCRRSIARAAISHRLGPNKQPPLDTITFLTVSVTSHFVLVWCTLHRASVRWRTFCAWRRMPLRSSTRQKTKSRRATSGPGQPWALHSRIRHTTAVRRQPTFWKPARAPMQLDSGISARGQSKPRRVRADDHYLLLFSRQGRLLVHCMHPYETLGPSKRTTRAQIHYKLATIGGRFVGTSLEYQVAWTP